MCVCVWHLSLLWSFALRCSRYDLLVSVRGLLIVTHICNGPLTSRPTEPNQGSSMLQRRVSTTGRVERRGKVKYIWIPTTFCTNEERQHFAFQFKSNDEVFVRIRTNLFFFFLRKVNMYLLFSSFTFRSILVMIVILGVAVVSSGESEFPIFCGIIE